MQAAFIAHDAFQCGYCTPGQLCSARGMLDEVARGWPSAVTDDLTRPAELTDAEIRERMAGNLCRCAAYPHIVAAVRETAASVVKAFRYHRPADVAEAVAAAGGRTAGRATWAAEPTWWT